MTEITRPTNENTYPCRSNALIDSNSLDQDLMNINLWDLTLSKVAQKRSQGGLPETAWHGAHLLAAAVG